MAVASYMLSFLAVRSATQGAKFVQQYAGPWLVWEPGDWRPAAGTTTTMVSTSSKTPGVGDALCFQLAHAKQVSIGRDSTCDVVVNDATVSRHHVTLHATSFGFDIESMKDVGSSVDGVALKRGERRILRWGASISLGNVKLSLFDDFGFAGRLKL
jgi:hypothetical protein